MFYVTNVNAEGEKEMLIYSCRKIVHLVIVLKIRIVLIIKQACKTQIIVTNQLLRLHPWKLKWTGLGILACSGLTGSIFRRPMILQMMVTGSNFSLEGTVDRTKTNLFKL